MPTKSQKVNKSTNLYDPLEYRATEYALATYTGLAFIHIAKNKQDASVKADATSKSSATSSKKSPPLYEVQKLNEVYLKDRNVSRFVEYVEDKFAVCLFKDDHIYLVNRKKESVVAKIKNPLGKSCNYEICVIPNFHLQTLPFLFVRDDKSLYLLGVGENYLKLLKLHAAKYESVTSY